MKNIPKKIYLNIGDDLPGLDFIDPDEDFNDLSGVTWSKDQVGRGDFEYHYRGGWISVKDELPELGVKVLIWDEERQRAITSERVTNQFYAYAFGWVICDVLQRPNTVKFWQPLPEPPKTD